MKKFKGYIPSYQLEDIEFLDNEAMCHLGFTGGKRIVSDIPVTITEGHDESIDQTLIGLFLGFLCGVISGFVVIFYCSTIPLGQ